MTARHFDYERYSVAQAAHPCLDWYVIDNDSEEIISTHALASQADAEAMNLNDNWDEERGMRAMERAFTRYWEGN
jgi:hypothetical protein